MEGAAFYLPGLSFGAGLWPGLRWPPRATVLLALLAGVVFLALYLISTMVGDDARLATNGFLMRWVVAPSLLAFWVGVAAGAGLAAMGGGGMK